MSKGWHGGAAFGEGTDDVSILSGRGASPIGVLLDVAREARRRGFGLRDGRVWVSDDRLTAGVMWQSGALVAREGV